MAPQTVGSIMTKDVVTVTSDSSARTAVTLMGEKHIGCLVVVGETGPIGLVTETDIILKVVAAGKLLETILTLEIMSISFPQIQPHASLKEAARTMVEKKKRLLVFEKNKMLGIVTASDILRALIDLPEPRIGIDHVMSTRIVHLDEQVTIFDAVQQMASRRIGSVIVDRAGKPFGIFAERDLMTKVLAGNIPLKTKLGAVASSPLVTAPLGCDVAEAAKIMVSNHVRRLPIFREQDMVGIVTARDIVEAFASQP